jgi:hypothetical protein
MSNGEVELFLRDIAGSTVKNHMMMNFLWMIVYQLKNQIASYARNRGWRTTVE